MSRFFFLSLLPVPSPSFPEAENGPSVGQVSRPVRELPIDSKLAEESHRDLLQKTLKR
jgi:hypothetical protein